ncbi:glycosyl transferase family 2 [Microcella putealis]|uniref:Glycosyl transferase family 2 n=1 Tax=Microcella putealis TaxID=337005 RepID=A0A4Q7LSK1_9MICO|nr:glycosyltransferase family 2 protein [Microcella putealis]RZS57403.1 glycosyl transferase family 2 [Microcella putealis]TQM19454.1 glycosyl transferase family 2 [Microcella putealis]
MRLAMTLMVRDEVDVVAAMLEHHRAQGIDVFIVTDNGSVDGTVEAIERFAQTAEVDLRHDPVHRKQQSATVTRMARDAHSQHGADWVINADADEFWVPTREAKLRERFATVPREIGTFQVPVVDLTGTPALNGTGFDRLIWRDLRPLEQLQLAGLHAHSTPNAVHIGDPEIVVSQGNHEVSRPAGKLPPEGPGIEVLHLPWRSWNQFAKKVENSGKAYEANPEMTPSPNHHGMRDYRRWSEGTLLSTYVARHPSAAELAAGRELGWFTEETRLSTSGLPAVPDQPLEDHENLLRQGRAVIAREWENTRQLEALNAELREFHRKLSEVEKALDSSEAEVASLRARRLVRIVDHLRHRSSRVFASSPRPVKHRPQDPGE